MYSCELLLRRRSSPDETILTLLVRSQTPTLNARPIVRGIVEACSRGGKAKEGIQVTLFLDLGFNDKGESIPFQGGTNEQVVARLYSQLSSKGKAENLHVYWYTGKPLSIELDEGNRD